MKARKLALLLSLMFFHILGFAQPCMIPVNAVNFQQIKRDRYYLTVSSVFNSSIDKENLSNYIKKQP